MRGPRVWRNPRLGTPKDVPEFTVLGFGSEELRVADYSEDVERLVILGSD